MNKDYWYVGQKVSEQRYGDGIITDIKSESNYPIIVNFKHVGFISFTIDGKEGINDKFSSLSPYPHVPIKYNKVFKKGEIVWYCPSNGLWYLGVYDSLEEKTHKVNTGYENNGAFSFDYLTDEQIKKFIELKV